MHDLSDVLVVVDYQKDFVDGSLGFNKASLIEDKILERIEKYLKINRGVFFTFDTHSENYLETREGRALPIKHCIYKTSGWDLYGKLSKYQDFKTKNTYKILKKTFGSNSLQFEINSNFTKINSIEICGLVTNLCVLSNAVMLQNSFVDTKIVINAELCSSYDEELHEKALDIMTGLQFEVINR